MNTIDFLDKKPRSISNKLFVVISFIVGIILSFALKSEVILNWSNKQIAQSFTPIFTDNANAIGVFQSLIFQLNYEIVFIFISFAASFSLIPKTFLSIILTVRGYLVAVNTRVVFQASQSISFFAKSVTCVFMIVCSFVFLHYVWILTDSFDLTNENASTNELFIIFSVRTRIRLINTLSACGSIILINLLKALTLSLTLLF